MTMGPPRHAARPRAAWLALMLLASGCAEVARPSSAPVSGALSAGAADPLRGVLAAAAADFQDGGTALAGRPAATALAAARLEYLVATAPDDPRWPLLGERVARELVLARSEMRDAIGIDPAADPGVVTAALLAAAQALRAGDPAAAARALPAPPFRPGGAGSVARLGDPGPLPQAGNATALASTSAARRDVEGNWVGGRTTEVAAGGIVSGGVPRDAGY